MKSNKFQVAVGRGFLALVAIFIAITIFPMMKRKVSGKPEFVSVHLVNLQDGRCFDLDFKPLPKMEAVDPFGVGYQLVVNYFHPQDTVPAVRIFVNGDEQLLDYGPSKVGERCTFTYSLGNLGDGEGVQVRLVATGTLKREVATVEWATDTPEIQWMPAVMNQGVVKLDWAALGLSVDDSATVELASGGGKAKHGPSPISLSQTLYVKRSPYTATYKIFGHESFVLLDKSIVPPKGFIKSRFVDEPKSKLYMERTGGGPADYWRYHRMPEWNAGWISTSDQPKEEIDREPFHLSNFNSEDIKLGNVSLAYPVGVPKLEQSISKESTGETPIPRDHYRWTESPDTPYWQLRICVDPNLKSKFLRITAYDATGKSLGSFPAHPTIHEGVFEAKNLPTFKPITISKVEVYSQAIQETKFKDARPTL